MGQSDWSPEAWEMARGCAFYRGQGGVIATLRRDRAVINGYGKTSTEAMRSLARNLDKEGWTRD